MKQRLIDIFLTIIIFVLGFLSCYFFLPRIVIKEIPKEKIVQIQGKDTVQTIIKYIPKQTDPQTSEKEKVDVELNIPRSEIVVKLNDEIYPIIPEFQEEYKFENGKLVFNQSSSISLDLKLPEPKRSIEIGGYLGSDSFGGLIIIPYSNGSYIFSAGPEYGNLKNWNYFVGITWSF